MEKYKAHQSSVFKNFPKSLRGDIISGTQFQQWPHMYWLPAVPAAWHSYRIPVRGHNAAAFCNSWNPFGHLVIQNCKEPLVNKAPAICWKEMKGVNT